MDLNEDFRTGLDCFVSYLGEESTAAVVRRLREEPLVRQVFVLTAPGQECRAEGCETIQTSHFLSSGTLRRIVDAVQAPYALVCQGGEAVSFGYKAIRRMYMVARNTDSAMVYADRYEVGGGESVACPTTDIYYGSVRDDFDFGPVRLYSSAALSLYRKENGEADYGCSGWYDLHLFLLRRKRMGTLFHVREYLYQVERADFRKSGEIQFDYVDPRNREVQLEREAVCAKHLRLIGAYVEPDSVVDVVTERYEFDIEASVIIPVKDRVKTIGDAIQSALAQQTDFKFNILVVDNHSTDGTSEVIERMAADDARVLHLVPDRTDLGIGGCWTMAFSDQRCGRYAVQLDSDDLYSGPDTLTRIVEKFRAEHCGMVVGSYRICDFNLNTLPPGLIDHREWTAENGHNNALRVNGFGAPRAFFTPLLRKIGMPNTSYGEDYAVGLAFSHRYKVGRIFDELYLCRRWEGNSDSNLTPQQVNRNNVYKDSLRTMEIISRRHLNEYWQMSMDDGCADRLFEQQLPRWKTAREHYEQLAGVDTRDFQTDGVRITTQFNPARAGSTNAKVDPESIRHRPCFLCDINLPAEQICYPVLKRYFLLVNPYPILPKHFTIPSRGHCAQRIKPYFEDMIDIAARMRGMMVFYNGPQCGASAPDHMHFQAGSRGVVPLERDWARIYRPKLSRLWPVTDEECLQALDMGMMDGVSGVYLLRGYLCPGVAIIARTAAVGKALFDKIYQVMEVKEGHYEPMMNILSWRADREEAGADCVVTVIIPRSKHRPDCFFASGPDQMMVSPGALDMGGMLITPRREDFERLDAERAKAIIRECGVSPDEERDLVMAFKRVVL